MKKISQNVKKNPIENMFIEIKIQSEGDQRAVNIFKDHRSDNLSITRSQASLLMDKIEEVVENFKASGIL